MKTTFKNKKAFTLIELLIVIAIIGILFIVLVSKVDFATDKAKATGVQTDFRSFQVAFEQVAKENAGFNTFGWDTGDTNGDRIRNSYDAGDANQDGVCDADEVWTGRKVYAETWTGVYTLIKPGADVLDADAIFALESAINKNLDPKLHITISTDGVITMANQATDPWNNEYHGRYQSNAAVDNLDRGVIIMYSDGANGVNGSADGIAGGLVNITTPGNNVQGKDDYAIATFYTYANGYGEVKTITHGFSNNQTFNDAKDVPVTPVGQAPSVVVPTPGGEGVTLPTPNLEGTIANSVSPFVYEWSELKALAQANISADELRDTYGIEVGDYKEVNGVRYVLVDLDGNDYDGFVFMYNTGTYKAMNSTNINKGGYVSTNVMKPYIDGLYDGLATDLKSAMKKVTITCNSGDIAADGTDDNGMSTYTTDAYMFLASSKEVGFTSNLSVYQYAAEGTCFDLFTTDSSSRKGFMSVANISADWWLRSADSAGSAAFGNVDSDGYNIADYALNTYLVVPAFVIGNSLPSVVDPTPDVPVDPQPGGGTGSLPTPDLTGAVANSVSPITYEWSELKTLAQANLSADELRDTYGIEVGDYKEVNGVKYILVDLDGNNYDGFVFMYNSGATSKLNSSSTNKGGYVSTDVGKAYVDSLYTNLSDSDLKNSIKKVTITCNSGDVNADGTDDNGMSTYTTDAYMFLASMKEIGTNLSGYQYAEEGSVFDYFVAGTPTVRQNFETLTNISSEWWVRSAHSGTTYSFHFVYTYGYGHGDSVKNAYVVVPVFVIG